MNKIKKIFLGIGALAIVGLFIFAPKVSSQALGASIFVTQQGGTGSSSPSGILNGKGSSIRTLLIGSNLTFDGTTLSATGGSAFPFTPFASYNGTSTPIGFSAGLFTNGSTTLAQLGTGFVQSTNGLLSSAALTLGQITTALGFTPANQATTITLNGTTNQLTSSAGAQDLSANRTWTLSLPSHVIFPGNFQVNNSTTTNATTTGSQYFTGVGTLGGLAIDSVGKVYSAATSTLSTISGLLNLGTQVTGTLGVGNGGTGSTTLTGILKGNGTSQVQTAVNGTDYSLISALTCGAGSHFSAVLSTGTFTCSADTGAGGTGLATSSPTANDQVLVYNSAGSGSAYSIATTSLTVSGPFTIASPIGVLKNGAITYTGLATTSNLTQGQVLYNTTNGNGVASVGTSTPTVTAPITYSGTLGAFVGGVGGAFDCTAASLSVKGCLTAADYTIFNNKISSSSLSGASVISYNSGTGVITTTPGTFAGATAYTFPQDLIITGNSTSTVGAFTTSASTTALTISNAPSCSGSNALTTNSSGLVACGAITGGGGAYPFTPSTQFGLGTSATTTPLQLTAGFTASSTAWISNLVAGTTTGQTFLNAPIVAGINSNNYAQIAIQNLSTGNNASSLFAAHADIGTDTKYYTEFGINNSRYSQAAFSSQNPLDSFLISSDGALVIGTASTTNTRADIRFTVGGTASSSIKAIIKPTGDFGIATTAPSAKFAIHANPIDSTASRSLFAIGSSTAAATTTLLTVRNSGFVGIGKAAPTDVLDVVGNVLVEDTSNSKSYRLRTTGGSLDFEASGAAMFYSVWSAAAFGGTQQNYLKLNASSQSAVGFGDWEFQTGNSGNGGTPTISIKSATNNVGVGSTSPYAKLSVHVNPNDLSVRTTLFAIGSSTASATTTLFSVSNIGQVTSNSSTSQLVLSDLSRSNQWHLRSISGNFFLATSTFGGSTTTVPVLSLVGTTGFMGFGTSTPFAKFSVDVTNLIAGWVFSIGSSVATLFHTTSGGQTTTCETKVATSSVTTINWVGTTAGSSCNKMVVGVGTSAMTIQFINATTSAENGGNKLLTVCNPSAGTAGALTFVGVEWAGATVPTQTTTANQCDVYSLYVTSATSTTNGTTASYKLFGGQSSGYQ